MVIAGLRPGGRSARIQASVHQAVKTLQQTSGRDALSVPLIAAAAGVTPSTIYRRWGDLSQLLSDVALDTMHADMPPVDTGTFAGDLSVWLDQFLEEMSSGPGREMMRDVLGSADYRDSAKCADITRQTLNVMRERAMARGEAVIDADLIMDRVVAPVFYRILLTPETPTHAYVQGLLQSLLGK